MQGAARLTGVPRSGLAAAAAAVAALGVVSSNKEVQAGLGSGLSLPGHMLLPHAHGEQPASSPELISQRLKAWLVQQGADISNLEFKPSKVRGGLALRSC